MRGRVYHDRDTNGSKNGNDNALQLVRVLLFDVDRNVAHLVSTNHWGEWALQVDASARHIVHVDVSSIQSRPEHPAVSEATTSSYVAGLLHEGAPRMIPQAPVGNSSLYDVSIGFNYTTRVKSMVVLGDSIASGEGIGYNYAWNGSAWNYDPSLNVTWEQPYPLCHQTVLAYGNLVAKALNASLTKLACTGSTYTNGIVGERFEKATLTKNRIVYSPAQFGDWVSKQDLNSLYDQARPDVVVITLGADDVQFADIVKGCIESFKRDKVKREACTFGDPGKTIEQDYFQALPKLLQNYGSLVQAIQARGSASGHVPRIVFTTYANPLPSNNEPCSETFFFNRDTFNLNRSNISYLNYLFNSLISNITTTLGAMDGVTVADISAVYNGHQWCSDDPWAYGLSLLRHDLSIQAPFHPTPAGQAAIAAIVQATIEASD